MAVSAGRYPVLWVEKAAVVSAPARIDEGNAGDFLTCLRAVIHDGAARLIVDMTATTLCDSAGANALIEACAQARASGAGMRLAASGPSVRRVLGSTGAGRLIATDPTVPESLMGELAPQPSSKAGG
jgi:anti-sigma B factor antagonist